MLLFLTCQETKEAKNIPVVEEERVAGVCECLKCLFVLPGMLWYGSRLGPSERTSPLGAWRTVMCIAQLAVFNETFLHFPMKQQFSASKKIFISTVKSRSLFCIEKSQKETAPVWTVARVNGLSISLIKTLVTAAFSFFLVQLQHREKKVFIFTSCSCRSCYSDCN